MNKLSKTGKAAIVNWKTTLLGVLAAFVVIAKQAQFALDDDLATVMDWNTIIAAIVGAAALFSARDADKSSEDSGTRPTLFSNTGKRAGILFLLIALPFSLIGCANLQPDNLFESPKAKVSQEIADQANSLDIAIRALITARQTGLLSARQNVALEPHVTEMKNSIDRAWSMLGRDDVEGAKTELEFFTHLRNQFTVYLNRSIGNDTRSTDSPTGPTSRRRSPEPDSGDRKAQAAERDNGTRGARRRGEARAIAGRDVFALSSTRRGRQATAGGGSPFVGRVVMSDAVGF